MKKAIEDIDTGMARAMRFSLFPEERDKHMLEKFAHEIGSAESPAPILETHRFCGLAEALEVNCGGLDALRKIIEHCPLVQKMLAKDRRR